MKRNLFLIIVTLVVLLLIASLALHLHQQSKKEVLSQFNEHQLDVARQIAREIEAHLQAYAVCLQMLASLPSLQYNARRQMAADLSANFEYLRGLHAQAISVYDEKGKIVYSAIPGKPDLEDWPAEVLAEMKKRENRKEILILPLIRRTSQPPHFRFLVATPLYQETVDARYPRPTRNFIGILSLAVDLEELLVEHLTFIRPRMNLHQVWLMDKDGTLLFQSEHPEMGLRDIHERNETCRQCHISFDYAEKMVREKQGIAEYRLKGYPKKLAAFAPITFGNASWIVVVDSPYRKVVSFTTKSSRDTLWLLGVVVFALMAGLALVCRDYRLKVRAEEEARQLREKRTLEDRIKESEERYRRLVELSPDAVAVHSQGQIVFINTTGAKLLGAETPDQLIGKSIMDFVHPDYRAIAEDRVREMKGEGRKVPLIEEKFIGCDGSVTDVEVAAIPFTYEGRPGVQVVFRDITERKQADEEIRKLNEDLTRRAIELEAANKELEAFTYSVSHDLRNPLLVIEGFSRRLLQAYSGCLDSTGQRYLNIIKGMTRNMGQLIEDLLAFSRSGRQEIKSAEINMDELAKTVFEELKGMATDRALRLSVNPLPPAHGDPSLIRQVFVNLLTNAIKYTGPRETGVIEMGCRVEEEEKIYYIKDNGVGFDMRHYDKLFNVFQRLHAAEEFEGTGVGLATVQRIIERHGGRVWAEGKVNEGATFYFSLPVRPLFHHD